MKTAPRLALAATLVLASAGLADAMPATPLGSSSGSLLQNVDVTVTKTVRRGPLGGRIVNRQIVRRGPFGGRSVTVTKTVR